MSDEQKLSGEEGGIPLVVLTNERTPFKAQQILMLYQAVHAAQLAYMDGLNPGTGEVEPLLVGLEPTDDGQFRVFPLAKLLSKLDEVPAYQVPDGQGGYINASDGAGDELAAIPEEEGKAPEG